MTLFYIVLKNLLNRCYDNIIIFFVIVLINKHDNIGIIVVDLRKKLLFTTHFLLNVDSMNPPRRLRRCIHFT